MKISSKGRYALVSMIVLAQNDSQGGCMTVLAIAQKLDISKIYLEQVFSMLRRGGLVTATKGSQGGYQLSRPPKDITAFDILAVTELSLFGDTEGTVKDSAPDIEQVLRESLFEPACESLVNAFQGVCLSELVESVRQKSGDGNYMYYL